MTIPSFVAISEADYASGTTLTWSHTIAAGNDRLLLVAVTTEHGSLPAPNVSGITYGGVALTKINEINLDVSPNTNVTEVWALVAPAVGTADIVVTWASAPAAGNGAGLNVVDAKQSVPTLSAVETQNGGASFLLDLTTTVADSLVVDAVGGSNTVTLAVSGATIRGNNAGPSSVLAVSTRPAASPGAVTNTWTRSDAASMSRTTGVIVQVEPVPPADTTDPVVTMDAVHGSGEAESMFDAAGYDAEADGFTISGTASDVGLGVDRVEVTLDAGDPVVATGTTTWSLFIDMSLELDGEHTLTAIAYDEAGNASTPVVRTFWRSADSCWVASGTPGTHLLAAAMQVHD